MSNEEKIKIIREKIWNGNFNLSKEEQSLIVCSPEMWEELALSLKNNSASFPKKSGILSMKPMLR